MMSFYIKIPILSQNYNFLFLSGLCLLSGLGYIYVDVSKFYIFPLILTLLFNYSVSDTL